MMLAEESSVNDALGHEVAFKVAQKLKPADSTKFRSFVDDVGYITMLLLSLSGRLARIENALHSIGEKSADKVSGMFHSRALRKQIITFELIFKIIFLSLFDSLHNRKFWRVSATDFSSS